MVSKIESVLLTIFIFFCIGFSVIKLEVSPHIPILFGIVLLLAFGFMKKIDWSTMEKGMISSISAGIPSIFIFLLVGVLISIWIAAGTIPTLMVYGFQLVSPKIFVPTVFVVCAIVGTSIGSAFTTAATVGLAFMGMGTALGYDPALIAGAIISGAFFGDKMSPLSDTTNLAPAVTGVDLFEHIRNMLWTTVPAFIIAFIAFFILGSGSGGNVDFSAFINTLEKNATISIVTLIPILLLFLFAFKKVPAVPTLLAGIVVGIIILFIFKPSTSLADLIKIMQDGYVSKTGIKDIDSLLSRGGLQSMMMSIALIFLALCMGGLLQGMGIIAQLMNIISSFVKTSTRLIISTASTAIGVNFLLGEQYLSIVLTGQAFANKYDEVGLERRNLSRVLEDAGTVINPLVPWGVSGVFLTNVLSVPTFDYLPYAIFCLACPVVTIIVGFTGFGLSWKKEKAVPVS
ncbi:TPA: Na+/H+ antiporter NhaC [Bacillus thuringiensis]|jgi:Na+:H+ antiporter, NhaC family|uniref:Na+/H+ antiporter NhaC n=7 Tax=Bacillus cereus group TaxID=86661 RepID=A0A9X6VWZ0_BACCE|nr:MULTISPECIES: Na+/H+ antiporter NhaC [Bacillus]MCO4216713.1 Na+/H+ antiporter NhaC [Bacillus sp. 10017]NIE94035.1 Na+/H+ antiporter NhaC [Bacillus sp. Ab-1751]OUB10501.1 Na+/H+ antiporter NhaC [Bacillus thuringiensis serovar yunnanensis]BCA33177.1 tyrosine transporter [Bacillus wiedmannii]AGE80002.1 Na+/H+ antiporter NhaC [Bacillus thuringiensis serovar kurstaki str. HD73]